MVSKSRSQDLVYSCIAAQLRIEPAAFDDTYTFEELEMDALDILLVVLRLEQFECGSGDFPLAALNSAETIGDLVALVDRWLANTPARPSTAVRA